MSTEYNKAIVALIMGILGILNLVFPGKIGLDETTVTAIVTAVTPILVYLIPNKPKTGG